MKTKMVSYTLETLPPLTEADRAKLRGGVSLQNSGKDDRQGAPIHCGSAANSKQIKADG